MAHSHSHTHDHGHHHHAPAIRSVNRALVIGVILNTVYVLAEFGAGFHYDSLALVADAGHNLSDVVSLLLSLLAFRLARVRTTSTFTYGFRKSTVLASLINAVLLLVTIGAIVWESVHRFRSPEPVQGGPVAWVAGLGILINTASALLFYRDKDHDLNVKGAYLHLAADALVSLGVVVSGILIQYTGWFWLDAATGLAVAVVIFVSTWQLLSDSVRLSLDGVPADIDLEAVKAEIGRVGGIQAVHHVHVWAMSTTENALTAHLVLRDDVPTTEIEPLKHRVRHQLEHLNIQHSTLETEWTQAPCNEPDCEN
ncbi:cation diffusion facilitator family transporter [Larkinella soli]|uniref:cation diffusion facilitator family transporter n=1 Tax=Larkinella soli TaxID=1770527 RepID=UPI000FFBEBF5|nr:cation diffusion facilitator family transporter [Larkinella soli]